MVRDSVSIGAGAGFVRELFGDLNAVSLEIDPRDEMFLFLLAAVGNDLALALALYYQSGVEAAWMYREVLSWAFTPSAGPGDILDFASGYGRVARYLPRLAPSASIWVSDVLPAAVRFQVSRFGVHGIVSHRRPEDLLTPVQFDAIFVLSLFTHLPPFTFGRWLRKLTGQLSDRGVLFFTTHGLSLAGERGEGVEDILFEPVSEIPSINVTDYGRTFVSERYVRDCIETITTGPMTYRYFPRGLGGHQDVYVVSKDPKLKLSDLSLPQRVLYRPNRFALMESELVAQGWAVATTPGDEIQSIVCRLNGTAIAQAELGPVYNLSSDPPYVAKDWLLRAPLAGVAPESKISLVATTTGHSLGLWTGSKIDSELTEMEIIPLEQQAALADLRAELVVLRPQLEVALAGRDDAEAALADLRAELAELRPQLGVALAGRDDAEAALADLRAELAELRIQLEVALAGCEAATESLRALTNTRSWRMTTPLRGVVDRLSSIRGR